MTRFLGVAACIASALAPIAAPAQESDLRPLSAATRQAFGDGAFYRPIGPWARSSSDRRCGLIREFERDGERIALQVQRLHSDTAAQFVLAGTQLEARNSVAAAFWPSAGLSTFERVGSATIGERPGIHFAGAHLPSTSADVTDVISAAERVGCFVVEGTGSRSYVLATGPLTEVLTALDACAEARLAALGFDHEAHASVSQPARIVDVEEFARDLRRVYRDYLSSEGTMWLRIGVDAEGTLSDCASTDDLMPLGFRNEVCAALAEPGRLAAARDGAGRPLADFFFQAIGFESGAGNWPNADGTDPYR